MALISSIVLLCWAVMRHVTIVLPPNTAPGEQTIEKPTAPSNETSILGNKAKEWFQAAVTIVDKATDAAIIAKEKAEKAAVDAKEAAEKAVAAAKEAAENAVADGWEKAKEATEAAQNAAKWAKRIIIVLLVVLALTVFSRMLGMWFKLFGRKKSKEEMKSFLANNEELIARVAALEERLEVVEKVAEIKEIHRKQKILSVMK